MKHIYLFTDRHDNKQAFVTLHALEHSLKLTYKKTGKPVIENIDGRKDVYLQGHVIGSVNVVALHEKADHLLV